MLVDSVEQSWRLWEEARALIPMGTQTHSKAPREALRGNEPCFLVRGEGGRVWDVDGNEYIDLRCGLGPISLGHRFPAVEAAIREQLENGLIFSYASPLEVEVARRHGALLIFDEIVMGFRLARAGAQEFFGVTPDLAVFAKGISNGAPLSCYLGRRDVMETVRRATISSTFGGDTLALAAARAAIDTYRQEDVIGHLWARGRQLQDGLNGLFREFEAPAAVTSFPPCCLISFTTPDSKQNAALFLQFDRQLFP